MKADGKSGAPDPQFSPQDFAEIISLVPEGCPIVGGQAVAWWAQRYGLFGSNHEPITSTDIDFWGSRKDLETLASKLSIQPIFPHTYEMTVWVGAIPLVIHGERSLADFLHTVPGLDIIDPEKASVDQEFFWAGNTKVISVLSPVSLVMAKLHAMRHFDQKERQDEMHLAVSLRASCAFLSELLETREIRHMLWNIERLISAHALKPYRRLEEKHQFSILSGVPIEQLREASQTSELPSESREKLVHFLERRWAQVIAGA
jgi:hypothetical protein